MGTCGSSTVKCPDSAGLEVGGTVPVYVNVYNLQNGPSPPPTAASAAAAAAAPAAAAGADPGRKKSRTLNQSLGLGFYHSGVELFGREWSFGGGEAPAGQCGIFQLPPRHALPARQFHDHILVGRLPPGTQHYDLERILRRMSAAWGMGSYHLLRHNCNHFSEALLAELSGEFMAPNGLATLTLPSYVNRAAKLGNAVIPQRVYSAVTADTTPPQPPAVGLSGRGPVPSPGPQVPSSAHSPGDSGDGNGSPAAISPRGLPKTRAVAEGMTIRQLRTVMFQHGIPWQDCVEKGDMIDCILDFDATIDSLAE